MDVENARLEDNMTPGELELVKLVDQKIDALAERFEHSQAEMRESFDRLAKTLTTSAQENAAEHTALSSRIGKLEDPPISLVQKRLAVTKKVLIWVFIITLTVKEIVPARAISFLTGLFSQG